MTEPRSYSISVRVRRVTVEEGYLRVPVDASVMRPEPAADGSYRLDTDKLWAEARRLAGELTDWSVEEQSVDIHPIQKAPPGVLDSGSSTP